MHMSVIGNPLVVLAGMQDLNKVYKTGVLASSSLCSLLKERAHKFSFWPSKRIEVEQRDFISIFIVLAICFTIQICKSLCLTAYFAKDPKRLRARSIPIAFL